MLNVKQESFEFQFSSRWFGRLDKTNFIYSLSNNTMAVIKID